MEMRQTGDQPECGSITGRVLECRDHAEVATIIVVSEPSPHRGPIALGADRVGNDRVSETTAHVGRRRGGANVSRETR